MHLQVLTAVMAYLLCSIHLMSASFSLSSFHRGTTHDCDLDVVHSEQAGANDQDAEGKGEKPSDSTGSGSAVSVPCALRRGSSSSALGMSDVSDDRAKVRMQRAERKRSGQGLPELSEILELEQREAREADNASCSDTHVGQGQPQQPDASVAPTETKKIRLVL